MFLDILFPPTCAGCRRLIYKQEEGFCHTCWKAMPWLLGRVCRRCGLPLPQGGGKCYDCSRHPFAFEVLRAACILQPPLQPAIHQLKYRSCLPLAFSLSRLLIQTLGRHPELSPIDGLIPVPLHPSARRRRGFNQSEALSEALSRTLGIPVFRDALRKIRRTPRQVALSREARKTNMLGAFAAHPSPSWHRASVLLVDDVCTTGATLNACARALRAVGACRVKALVLARDV